MAAATVAAEAAVAPAPLLPVAEAVARPRPARVAALAPQVALQRAARPLRERAADRVLRVTVAAPWRPGRQVAAPALRVKPGQRARPAAQPVPPRPVVLLVAQLALLRQDMAQPVRPRPPHRWRPGQRRHPRRPRAARRRQAPASAPQPSPRRRAPSA